MSVDEGMLIRAPADAVWRAIVDDDVRAGWWAHLELDARPGGRFEERWTDETGRAVVTMGEVLEIVSTRLLRMTWADDDWSVDTEVSITLDDLGDATVLRVRHSGWDGLPDSGGLVADHRAGWRVHLENLRRHVERAEGLASTSQESP